MKTINKNQKSKLGLEEAAQRMTEIIQQSLDKFPEEERQKRLKKYLSTPLSRDSSTGDSAAPSKAPKSHRTPKSHARYPSL